MHARLFSARRFLVTNQSGFSLVEVCLALGIIAFAVLPVLGLLSIGLNTYRNTESRDRATQILSQIGSSLSLAKAVADVNGTPTGIFTAQPPYQYSTTAANPNAIHWQWDQSEQQIPFYFDQNGTLTTSGSATARMVALVILQAPAHQATPAPGSVQIIAPGSAQIVVVWPALSVPTYTDAAGIKFSNIEGHVETTVSLLSTGL